MPVPSWNRPYRRRQPRKNRYRQKTLKAARPDFPILLCDFLSFHMPYEILRKFYDRFPHSPDTATFQHHPAHHPIPDAGVPDRVVPAILLSGVPTDGEMLHQCLFQQDFLIQIPEVFFSDDELHSFAEVHQFHIPSALPPGTDIVLSAVRMPTFGVSEEGIDPVKSKTEHLLYLPTGKTS